MGPREELLSAYERFGGLIPSYMWPSEATRWSELLFCLLNQIEDLSSQQARDVVSLLEFFGLASPERLSRLTDDSIQSEDDRHLIAALLRREGASDEVVTGATKTLRVLGWWAQERYGGRIQQSLRRLGDSFVEELTEGLAVDPEDREATDRGLRLWLQNVANLPVQLESRALARFRERHGIEPDDLVGIADGLNLNLAVVDDLLAMAEQAEAVAAADPDG